MNKGEQAGNTEEHSSRDRRNRHQNVQQHAGNNGSVMNNAGPARAEQ
jgi:hypothetical protein